MKGIKIIPSTTIKINKKTLFGFLKIINQSQERRAFKIKTTRPEDYVVKPSIGILQPMEEIIIEINILEDYKISDAHKFAVEIYEINWRQSVETIKRYLKTTQINPLLLHRMGIEYEKEKKNGII